MKVKEINVSYGEKKVVNYNSTDFRVGVTIELDEPCPIEELEEHTKEIKKPLKEIVKKEFKQRKRQR